MNGNNYFSSKNRGTFLQSLLLRLCFSVSKADIFNKLSSKNYACYIMNFSILGLPWFFNYPL
jgi:hypothetical protein